MEKMHVRDLMVPVDRFPKISYRTSFYEAVRALEAAQQKYMTGEARQRILLVEDDDHRIIGKLSPIDLLRGLETNYSRIVAENTLSRFGFTNIWKTIQEDYNLWGNPFHDLCRKAAQVQVKDFLKGPSEGQTVAVDDLMAKCFHLFVMNRHDSLFVVDGDQIVGLLRFSDVYQEVSKTMKECHIDTVPK
ncbi:CBS domain-containing protein [Desulfoprunum benzoelyticum]|uniref:Mg2+/Co2+ transporter CorC n=1 Tax=Desulfoprunum benzoelyticum TaxID=1506996 RepID=A0A840V149_9BACT|nr:CBS domain-containing protein [Desulfoprunum benzoelyticum]MBB5347429.1 Mg2+/Co2+ transporter CorC [Desulfoprunum benzoelyticum]MBM9529691.1 CBS domain-containing protein [Desulfoprunum benzoelyticum]